MSKVQITAMALESLRCVNNRLVEQYKLIDKARFKQFTKYGQIEKVTNQLYQQVVQEVRDALMLNAIGSYKKPKIRKRPFKSRSRFAKPGKGGK